MAKGFRIQGSSVGGVNHCSLDDHGKIRRCDWLEKSHNLEFQSGHL